MHCSTGHVQQDYGITGILYDMGSVYEKLTKLTDMRKAKGKLYALELVLLIVIMAKLCGEDKPLGMAEWAQNRQEELVALLKLNWARMPSHHTYRRILAYKVYEEEVERLVGSYNQHGEHGEVYALDGKARRGMRKKDEEGQEYGLSIYDVQQAKVMSQVEVGRKENEIVKAPQALKLAEISQKVITADAMHTQRGLATQILEARGNYVFPVKENQPQLYKNIQSLFAPEYPKPGFGKIQTDFLTAQKVNKGHGRIEIRECWAIDDLLAFEYIRHYEGWANLRSIALVRRERRTGEQVSVDTQLYISSLAADAERILSCSRLHWSIENSLHWVLDVVFHEDAARNRVKNSAENLTVLRHIALNLLKQTSTRKKTSVKGKRFLAGLDNDFLLQVLTQV